jgi:hypothetical protein
VKCDYSASRGRALGASTRSESKMDRPCLRQTRPSTCCRKDNRMRSSLRDTIDLGRDIGAHLLGMVLDACLLSLFLVHLRLSNRRRFGRSLNRICEVPYQTW